MAGDPPELAQDNPPPCPGGSTFPLPVQGRGQGRGAGKNNTLSLLKLIPPGAIVWVLAVLIVSQLLFAFLPYRHRAYLPILLMTAIGFALGQLWDFIGLPSARLGQANLLPALVFALLLQPAARFVPRPNREPKEPKPSNPQDSRPTRGQ
jgi:hypothetical protein